MWIGRRGFLKVVPGLVATLIGSDVFAGERNSVVEPEKFSLFSSPSIEKGRVVAQDYFIHYGNPPIFSQNSTLIYTNFKHPIPEVSRERLNCPDDRWEETDLILSRYHRDFPERCIDMKNAPLLIHFVREVLEDDPDLISIFYFNPEHGYSESGKLIFHPKYIHDYGFHRDRLLKLRNPMKKVRS